MQYYEDTISTLDTAKNFAGSALNYSLNPLASMRYSPGSFKVRAGAINVRRGILDENNWAHKGIKRLFDKYRPSTIQSGIGPVGLDNITKPFDSSKQSIFDYSKGKRAPLINGTKSVENMSKGFLTYGNGFIGLNENFNIGDTEFRKNIDAKIDGYEKRLKGGADLERERLKQAARERHSISSDTKRPGARGSLSAKEMKSKSITRRNVVARLDDFGDDLIQGGKSKGYLRFFGNTQKASRNRINLYAARVARFSHTAILKGAEFGVRATVFAAKVSSYAAIASLGWQATKMIGNPIGNAAMNAVDNSYSQLNSINNRDMSTLGMDFLSQGAATERQRAIQAISKSRINGRSMMGSEAAYMHQ